MKGLQSNAAAKVCAVLILLATTFGAGVFGVRAVLSFGSVADNSWQGSSGYYNAIDNRQRELIDGVYIIQRLEQLEKEIEDGSANAMTYADREVLQGSRTAIEERFSANNTWFRFCLMDAGTG